MKNTFAEKCNRCDNKFMQTVFASLRHKAEGRNDKVIFGLDGKNSVAENSIPFFFSPFNSIPKRNRLFIQDSSIEESLCSYFRLKL